MTDALTPLPGARVEDHRLLTGKGCFVADLDLPGLLHGSVVRAPVAHADIAGIDGRVARAMPGVHSVFTGADLAAAGIGPLPSRSPVVSRDGRPMIEPPRPILARDQVKHVGEAVAFVVAETEAQARDAAEAVAVEYRERPAVIGALAALAEAAPQVWPQAAGNVSFDWEAGDAAAVAAAFSAADRVVRARVAHPRLVVAPIEPRAALGRYDEADGRYVLHAPSQGVHGLRDLLAERVLRVPPAALQVMTADVGGSFGTKIFPYPEYALVLVAARALGRPVKWVCERSDAFLSDAQGRARVDDAAIALDRDGRVLAFQVDAVADLGAYLSTAGPFVPTSGAVRVLGHCYRIPAIHYRVRGVFTNATPVDAYRGAGKPESVATLERLIDRAARACGLDRVELRRRNLVRPSDLPYRSAVGETYDSGDFPAVLERVLALADWSGFPARRAAAEARGRRRGIGLGLYLHATGGSTAETTRVRALADGSIEIDSGTQASGQGHETALAVIAVDVLQIAPERIVVRQGDSDRLPRGGGTGGSALLTIAGTTLKRACEALIELGRAIAAEGLEAAVADIEYAGGIFRIVGSDREISLAAVAAAAEEAGGCVGECDFAGQHSSYPNGAYVAEVEVDPETGAAGLAAFTAVDDLGEVIAPALAEGQIHGGIAQGVGEALMEAAVYDPVSGQLLNGSFLDYWLPRADELPRFTLEQRPTRCRNNALGVKGAGEVAAIGTPGAVIAAVLDALAGDGVDDIEVPATPHRIWQAIRDARTSRRDP